MGYFPFISHKPTRTPLVEHWELVYILSGISVLNVKTVALLIMFTLQVRSDSY